MEWFELFKAVILGIVQGITEWLPISSTGHMILVDEFLSLKVSPDFWKLFEVVIQLGSILAVLVLYFHKLNPFSPKKTSDEKKSTVTMWLKVIVGVIPAAVLGFIFDDFLPNSPVVIALALIIYGIAFIIIENGNKKPKIKSIDELTYGKSLGIGLFQALSIIPGTSRSGSTILGGIILGSSREVAAEYSFFLAIPVMFGASLLRLVKFVLKGLAVSSTEWGILIVGTLVSFLVSIVAIKFLMSFIKKHDFKAFGWYRIILGVIVLLYFWI